MGIIIIGMLGIIILLLFFIALPSSSDIKDFEGNLKVEISRLKYKIKNKEKLNLRDYPNLSALFILFVIILCGMICCCVV